MSDPLSHDKLLKLLSIMQQMLVEATQANWQELDRLDNERRILIDFDPGFDKTKTIYKATVVSRSDNPGTIHRSNWTDSDCNSNNMDIKTLTKQIMQLDLSIMKTVTEARGMSLDQNRVLADQVKAKDCYARTSTITSARG